MSQASQFSLMTQRRFGPFFWTQFLGAFNDNLFKTALIIVLTYDALSWTTMSPARSTIRVITARMSSVSSTIKNRNCLGIAEPFSRTD